MTKAVKLYKRFSLIFISTVALALTACVNSNAEDSETDVMAPRLYRIILPVSAIDEAVGFYKAVLETHGERISPGRHYFNLGGTILAVYDPVADGDLAGDGWAHHQNQYIYIGVSDLEGAFDRAKRAGAEMQSEIETMPWGERLFYARDPSDNPICFVDEKTLFLSSEAQSQ